MRTGRKKDAVMLARFNGAAQLLEAAKKTCEAGYSKFDCHSPFPIHGMDDAMKQKRSPIGWIVGATAVIVLASAYLMMWWMSAVDYPLVISGKPYFSYVAYVPVGFALTILGSAFAAVLGMFYLNRLPRLFHPLFNSEQFAKVTDDGFFISIETDDPEYGREKTENFFKSIGGLNVEVVSG